MKNITTKELEELEVNLTKIDETEADKIANEFLSICQDYTMQQDKRVIFVSSIPKITW